MLSMHCSLHIKPVCIISSAVFQYVILTEEESSLFLTIQNTDKTCLFA